ncbi:MAG: alpha/beta hydrolase [Rhodanobacter sp.]
MCPPFGQDQIRSHRLYRQLAHALVAIGVPVLRFDVYGSGDSAGDSIDISWDRCVADAITAADELRRLSGCDHVLAFGARLGGSLAIAAAADAHFGSLIVWDPVLDGASYVARLDQLQEDLRIDTRRFLRPRSVASSTGQWQGFMVSDVFRRQLCDLQLDPSSVPARLIKSASSDTPTSGWGQFVAADEAVTCIQASTPWEDLNRLEIAILSHELIQVVCNQWHQAI